jgi:imidazolonepropionase-like amidohydrolase
VLTPSLQTDLWKTCRVAASEIYEYVPQAGTDLGTLLCYPGFGLHDELELLVNSIGLTPAEALQSTTRIPAEFMGLGASLGTVEKGKIADLVLLEANPIIDITNTRKIAAVVIGGRLIRSRIAGHAG